MKSKFKNSKKTTIEDNLQKSRSSKKIPSHGIDPPLPIIINTNSEAYAYIPLLLCSFIVIGYLISLT
jgi:hypothetical protein